MNFVDTHCHLFLDEFDHDRSVVLENSFKAGTTKLILPNVDNTTTQLLLDCASMNNKALFPALGIHPCSIKDNYKEELKIIEKTISLYKPIAIGEVGFDLYWDKTFASEQKLALEIQLSWAESLNIPVILHTRDAFESCYEIVLKFKNVRGVFHAFSGTEEQIKKVADIGFYFGIGGVITFKNGGLDKVLKHIPQSLVLLETDAPYLTPAPHRGKRNEPSYIPLIAEKVAYVYECEISEIAEQCWKNSHELFKI